MEVITIRPGYEPRFNKGDIVYWCRHQGNANYSVAYGMVDEQFSDAVCIDYLELKERRLVDGVPLEDFESGDHFRKLPKGWSCNTRLFEITYREEPNFNGEYIDITNPDCIKHAYDIGMLVKSDTIFHGNIEAEITKDGFRIRKTYPQWRHHITHTSVVPYKVYSTYDEAKKEVDENIAEFHRQAALSDYDWSVEQIDKTLNRWQKITDVSDIEKNKYRECLLAMKTVEDIETRIFDYHIQWKYWKNKRWNNIEL